MSLEQILQVVTLVGFAMSFAEWRVRTMKNEILEKIKDREEIQDVKIDELKASNLRVEAKLDALLSIIYGANKNGQGK